MITDKRLDVALSFAGEQRDYVRAVADYLKKDGIDIFYDEDSQEDMWGKPLAEVLNSIYAENARFVVVFVSQEYLNKQWTSFERRTILSAYVKDPSIFLPVSMDGTLELPGFPSDTVMLQSKDYTPEKLAQVIIRKIAQEKNISEKKAQENSTIITSDYILKEHQKKRNQELEKRIYRYNHQWISVRVEVNGVRAAGGIFAKGAKTSLHVEDALKLESEGKVSIIPEKYVAVQYLADMNHDKTGTLKPMKEVEAKNKEKQGVVKIVEKIGDLVMPIPEKML